MMKRNIKITLLLGATLALSFCQGRQSSIFDPTNGQNAMTAQHYLNSTTETRVLPESMRSQRFSLSYTTAQADACINSAAEGNEISLFCLQIINDYATKLYGPNYQSFVPENIAITAPNGKVFDFNHADRLSAQNAPWLPQYQQYIGGTNPNAATYFQTPYNMQGLCGGNATTMTNVRVGCGNMNWNYATIAVNSNTGYNYMRQGDFNRAGAYFQPGGTVQTLCTSRCPKMYGSVLSRRNIGKENAQLTRQVQQEWTQLKGMPKHMGLSILSGLMNVAGGIVAHAESNVNRSLSTAAANQYAQAYNNDQYTAYNNMMINQYTSAREMCEQSTVQAIAEQPCPDDQLHYVVGDTGGSGNEYRVLTCGGNS